MAAKYPGAIPTPKTNHATSDTILAATDNEHAEEIIAIAAELGTDAAGSSATVKARIAAVEGDLSGKVDSDDSRLSDQRTPSDGSVTAAKVSSSLKPSGSAGGTDESLRRLGTGSTHAAAGDDSRFPTAGQKSALAGTSGTPGSGNRFVTDQDSRLTNARTPTAHTHAPADITQAGATTGQALVWDGDEWAPDDVGGGSGPVPLADIEQSGAEDGDIIVWDDVEGAWVPGQVDSSGFVATSTISAAGQGVVNHGSTAGTARPSGFASIKWIGSVEPTNAVSGDTWVETA